MTSPKTLSPEPEDHAKAHRAVRAAILRGDLVRPEACEKCGASGRMSDGRSFIHGHHKDYSKPLEVEWLCVHCHRAVTPLPSRPGGKSFGEKNGASKLTYEQVAAIRVSPKGCWRLAREYGVDKKTIQYIRRGTTWKTTN